MGSGHDLALLMDVELMLNLTGALQADGGKEGSHGQ